MITFKKIDFWIQATGIFVFAILSFIRRDDTFMVGYFTVGALQVISILIHQFNGWFTNKGSNRYLYSFITLAAVVAMLASLVVPILLFVFYILLFAAPLMAITYTSICFRELKVLEAKALIHLK